ncbi:HAUS augmin-like complex subunit 1, partial [Elysia marginata]
VLDAAKTKEKEDSQLNAKKDYEITYFLQKERNYRKEIKKMESQLDHTKIDASLSHENLVKKSEALKEIQNQLEPLRAELESYSVLPPDLDMAKLKLTEYKIELEALNKQFLDCIGDTTM